MHVPFSTGNPFAATLRREVPFTLGSSGLQHTDNTIQSAKVSPLTLIESLGLNLAGNVTSSVNHFLGSPASPELSANVSAFANTAIDPVFAQQAISAPAINPQANNLVSNNAMIRSALSNIASASFNGEDLLNFALSKGTVILDFQELMQAGVPLNASQRQELITGFSSPGTLALAATFGDGSSAIVVDTQRVAQVAAIKGTSPLEELSGIFQEELNHVEDQASGLGGPVTLFDEAFLKGVYSFFATGTVPTQAEVDASAAKTIQDYMGSNLNPGSQDDVDTQAFQLMASMGQQFGPQGAELARAYVQRFVTSLQSQGALSPAIRVKSFEELLQTLSPSRALNGVANTI